MTDPGEPINLDGTGAAQSADQSVVDARGFADVGLGGTTDYGLPTGVTTTITFVVKTGASVTQGSTAYEGLRADRGSGRDDLRLRAVRPDLRQRLALAGQRGGVWRRRCGDHAGHQHRVHRDLRDRGRRPDPTFMGNTINSTVAFANPALGVNRVSIKVGAGFKLMSILVEDDQPSRYRPT